MPSPEDTQSLEFGKNLEVQETNIPGLLIIDLPVHGDERGWFKENWQLTKITEAGLPDFGPVQNNISFNAEAGVTRGIHAEPWDKYISLGKGRIFGAWVDLRDGESFGQVFTAEIDPAKAVFVPAGVGNALQALEPETVYTYLVNDHWSPNAKYTMLNLADETVNIPWPISLDTITLSEKDKNHPRLAEVEPVEPKKVFITGADGQLGRALQEEFPDAEFTTREDFDITDPNAYQDRNWRQYSAIINAAAYTAVDGAEAPEGRREAWKVNARAVELMGKVAIQNHLTLVHVSSDYVFDGTQELHTEDEDFTPLSVYGQTKAAGDIAASTVPSHYILRSSWVVGNGNNFVRAIQNLAEKGVKPNVVDDQSGRLTFTSDMARAVKHLLESNAEPGTYNLTNAGETASLADIAKAIYEASGHNPEDVSRTTTEEYYAGKEGIAPRPAHSTLNLTKIQSTGFEPRDWREALEEYVKQEDE